MASQNEHRQRATRQQQSGEAAFAETRKPIEQIRSARMSGDLLLMVAFIGVSRAVFGSVKPSVQHAAVSDQSQVARGRTAEAPSEIPAKGWMDIAWRVLEGFPSDRVMLVAAGVTFYALLALFPATAAVVSLYGLFTDATTITNHLGMLSGFLPAGALDVIGDQVKLLTAPKAKGRWVRLSWHVGAIPLGRERRHKGDLRRPQHHLQGTALSS